MFLVWWYTNGLMALLERLWNHVLDLVRALDLRLLAKYLFVPMYGYRDIGSRAISFAVRVVQFVFRLIYTIIYLILESIVILVWCILPIFVLLNLAYQLVGL